MVAVLIGELQLRVINEVIEIPYHRRGAAGHIHSLEIFLIYLIAPEGCKITLLVKSLEYVAQVHTQYQPRVGIQVHRTGRRLLRQLRSKPYEGRHTNSIFSNAGEMMVRPRYHLVVLPIDAELETDPRILVPGGRAPVIRYHFRSR